MRGGRLIATPAVELNRSGPQCSKGHSGLGGDWYRLMHSVLVAPACTAEGDARLGGYQVVEDQQLNQCE